MSTAQTNTHRHTHTLWSLRNSINTIILKIHIKLFYTPGFSWNHTDNKCFQESLCECTAAWQNTTRWQKYIEQKHNWNSFTSVEKCQTLFKIPFIQRQFYSKTIIKSWRKCQCNAFYSLQRFWICVCCSWGCRLRTGLIDLMFSAVLRCIRR